MRLVQSAVLLGYLAFLLAACGGGGLYEEGCQSDLECKHGRVCVDGKCEDQSQVCFDDSDCPAGYICYQGACLVCDRDGDGVFGEQCAGADCDDDNGAVKPGNDELCGDDLDNDCDGVTDPASLCDDLCADVRCDEGFACHPATGLCVPVCSPDCNDRVCGPDGCGGECGICPPGTHCTADGRCEAGCQDLCLRGERNCVGNSVVSCVDTDGDGCVEWSSPVACGDGERCLDGFCQGCVPDCEGKECGPDGCGGNCGPCPDGERCLEGFCQGCVPDCEGRECGPDGCGGNCGPCPDGMSCTDGRCVSGCADECDMGESRCMDAYSFQECGDWDDDRCLEFGPRQLCPEGSACDESEGRCSGGCWDECMQSESYCMDEMGYSQCGYWDEDHCLEFGPRISCDADEWCDPETGRCVSQCRDECWFGESMCLDEFSFSECGYWDGDSCLEFGPQMFCEGGDYCDPMSGQCNAGCQDECMPEESICLDEYTSQACGEFDGDPCLEWGFPVSCSPGEPCDPMTGRCGTGQTCELDSYEPDDDPSQASALQSGSLQAHSICPVGDEDWWSFELTEERIVFLETSGFSGDTVMWLFDSTMREIAFDDDGGNNLFSRISTGYLPPGLYHVRVREYGNQMPIESYSINLVLSTVCVPDCTNRECGPDPLCGEICGICPDEWSCTSNGRCVPGPTCEPDIYEPDDDPSSASTLEPTVPQAHSICPSNEEDWWVFTLEAPTDITVFTFGGEGDTLMWLYNSSNQELAYDDDSGYHLCSRIVMHDLPAGTYYVMVKEYSGSRDIDVYGIRLDL